jgi:ribonuclease BN (tRNA processing enzyme)
LIFDAQFTLLESFEKRTWGHSSAIVGVELACMAGVKKLALFHHDHNADDAMLEHLLKSARQYARAVPCSGNCEVIIAREGLTVEL